MRYEKVEYDFIERTLLILKQYSECYHIPPRKEKYTTTLLLNCFVGLLIFPFETNKRKVKHPADIFLFSGDSKPINELDKSWAISSFRFDKICDFNGNPIKRFETASLKLIIYRMRNSIAHSRWDQEEIGNNNLFYDAEENKDSQGVGIEYGVKEDDPNQSDIKSLVFTDRNGKNDLMFKASVTVKGLEKFMIQFAENVLKNLSST